VEQASALVSGAFDADFLVPTLPKVVWVEHARLLIALLMPTRIRACQWRF